MVKKSETKILSIITICIIFVTILVSGCFDDSSSSKTIEIEYKLTIKTDSNDSYKLIAPIFSNKELRSKIEIINGQGDISFINANISDISNYSSNDRIEIRGFGNIEVYGKHIIKYDGKKHTDDDLSLKNSNSNYWIWCDKNNNQNITIKIDASFITYTDGEEWYNDDEIKLENGWNLINIKEESWEG